MKQKLTRLFVFIFCINLTNSSRVYGVDDYQLEEGSLLGMAGQLVIYLIAFVFIVLLTFYGTKFLAKYSKKFSQGNNIRIVEQFSLGSNNKIMIVKIYDKTYVLSVNNNQTTVIDKLGTVNNKKDKEDKSLDKNRDFEKHLGSVLNSIDENSEDATLNNKLVNMKMKVLKLKNSKYRELLDKEEDNE